MAGAIIRIEGGKELRNLLDAAGGKELTSTLRDARKESAQAVVEEALPNVPVRTGRLKASTRALASQRSSQAVSGSATVPYAAAIHWGRKNGGFIKGRPFLWDAGQRVAERGEAARIFQEHVNGMLARVFGR